MSKAYHDPAISARGFTAGDTVAAGNVFLNDALPRGQREWMDDALLATEIRLLYV